MFSLSTAISRLFGCAVALSLAACAVVPPTQPGTSTPAPISSAASSASPSPTPTASGTASSASPTPKPTSTTASPANPTKPDCAKLKCIALTYDDGPYPDTARLVRVMKQVGVRATFFMTGANAKSRPSLVKDVASTGSVIANHSWNHPDLTKLSDAAMRAQLVETNAAIRAASGRKVTLVRPPYGARDARVDRLLKQLGMAGSLWNLDTMDWKFRDSARLEHCVLTYGRRNDVVLMHDIHPSTVSAARTIFRGLKQKGFTFVTVPQLYSHRLAGGYYPSLAGMRACN